MRGEIFTASLFCVAVAAGPAFAQSGAASHTQTAAYMQPQRMVAVEGKRRLNLYCIGKGEPTVLFDSGLADSMAVWRLVQGEVAKVTRACAYDRAGYGFSDPRPSPSDAQAAVADIHHLLAAAKIAKPIVYVGHSIAGLYGVLLQATYPNDVAAEVLVDPSFAEQMSVALAAMPPAKRKTVLASLYASVAQMKNCATIHGPLPEKCMGEDSHAGPKDTALAALQRKRVSQPGYMLTNASEYENTLPKGSTKSVDALEVENAHPSFGNKPLAVLTQSGNAEFWRIGHDQLAALSQRGSNAVITNTSHYIQIDQPKIVIDAVLKTVETVRKK